MAVEVSEERFEVRLFGPAREAAGMDRTLVTIAMPGTARDLISALVRSHPDLAPLLPRSRVAVNRRYVDADSELAGGDEVAIIPPVGGG